MYRKVESTALRALQNYCQILLSKFVLYVIVLKYANGVIIITLEKIPRTFLHREEKN
jgi:hypothetical protein